MSAVTLRVVLDYAGPDAPNGTSRYAIELTRALIATAPRGCDVSGFIPSSPEAVYDAVAAELPGLTSVFRSALDRRQLRAAWQHGFTRLPGTGLIHAPSLFAPLYRHDRLNPDGEQIVVTVPDAVAWTDPQSLPSSRVSWFRAMGRRAERHADAVVVPSHAVATELADSLSLGDRIRVIPAAPSLAIQAESRADDAARAEELALPERYMLAVGPFRHRDSVSELLEALAAPGAPAGPLVLVGSVDVPELTIDDAARDAGLDPARVIALGPVDDAHLGTVYRRAAALIVPSRDGGFALPVLEAMSQGVPVVHADSPGIGEIAADAGLAVARDASGTYPQRLAEALASILDDDQLASRLSIAGRDRARAFSWRDTAEKVWQLHADL